MRKVECRCIVVIQIVCGYGSETEKEKSVL